MVGNERVLKPSPIGDAADAGCIEPLFGKFRQSRI
jgi:hypothetical protein